MRHRARIYEGMKLLATPEDSSITLLCQTEERAKQVAEQIGRFGLGLKAEFQEYKTSTPDPVDYRVRITKEK